MLFFGSIFSIFTPAYLVTFQNTSEHCSSKTFTILAHYRLHEWLYNTFEEFKTTDNINGFRDLCFELVVTDSQFDSDVKPSLWIPENYMWLDEAEQDDDIYGSTLVSNRTTLCSDLANIPMGLVTWTQFAELLNYEIPLNYSDFLYLAEVGWNRYRMGDDVTYGDLLFSHAHPNVTASGVLGMILGYQTQWGLTNAGDIFDYKENLVTDSNFSVAVRNVESNIYELGPNEITVIANFLGHGPDYIHASLVIVDSYSSLL